MRDTDFIQEIQAKSQACRTLDPIPHTFEADNKTPAFELKGDARRSGFGFVGVCFSVLSIVCVTGNGAKYALVSDMKKQAPLHHRLFRSTLLICLMLLT